jgi:hypothetical protein
MFGLSSELMTKCSQPVELPREIVIDRLCARAEGGQVVAYQARRPTFEFAINPPVEDSFFMGRMALEEVDELLDRFRSQNVNLQSNAELGYKPSDTRVFEAECCGFSGIGAVERRKHERVLRIDVRDQPVFAGVPCRSKGFLLPVSGTSCEVLKQLIQSTMIFLELTRE